MEGKTMVDRGAEEEVFETPDLGDEDESLRNNVQRARHSLSPSKKVQDAEVISSTVPAQAAFEVFMGKTYIKDKDDSSSSNATRLSFMSKHYAAADTGELGATNIGDVFMGDGFRHDTESGSGSGMGTRLRTAESPIERLIRLREETALLARDLEELSKARQEIHGGGRGGAGDSDDVDEGTRSSGDGAAGGLDAADDGYALWTAMSRETEALQKQLAQLSGDPRYKHFTSPIPRTATSEGVVQQRLTEEVINALERLREGAGATAVEGLSQGGNAAQRDSSQTPASGHDGRSVTYELFLKEAAEARRPQTRKSDQDGQDLYKAEARIAALEKAVGAGDASSLGEGSMVGQPLTELVSSLENRINLLEPGKLENLKQKVHLTRSELDVLAKSKASNSRKTWDNPARRKKIEEAMATLQTWQGMAAGLPALVDRLHALEALHLASSSFLQRLERMEVSVEEVDSVLTKTAEGLEATRKSATENVSIVQDNVKALDQRLAGLDVKS